jgi:hypothetical protein
MAVAAIASTYKVLQNIRDKNSIPSVFVPYMNDRSSVINPDKIVRFDGPVRLPSTKPAKSIEVLMEQEIDETASIDIPDITLRTESSRLLLAGIGQAHNIPVIPDSSAHSVASCAIERGLTPQNFHGDSYDDTFFDKFESFVFMNFDSFFPGLRQVPVVPTSFAIWNKNFPKSRQLQQEQAMKACFDNGNYKEWNASYRNMFVKSEALSKSTPFGVPKLAPRMIQGATAYHNVQTGPFFSAFSKRLKDMWSVSRTYGPKYATSCSAEDVGSAFERGVTDIPDYAILEGDFSRFDTTVHRRLLELENRIYKMSGCPKRTLMVLKAAIKTRGFAKFGIKYEVDGTRHSGDPQTSCGNTMLQTLAMLFLLHVHTSIGLKELISKVSFFALGDDNLLIAPESMLVDFPVTSGLKKLGFTYEPKLHVGPNARFMCTFCSGRFYPVINSQNNPVTVLAPNAGRVYSKFGYYANPANDSREYLQRLVRGDALGRRSILSAIPCIRHLADHCLRLTSHVPNTRVVVDKSSGFMYNFRAHDHYFPYSETYRMTEIVYGIREADDIAYDSLLTQVTELPAMVNFEPLRRAAVVDGDLSEEHHHEDSADESFDLQSEEFDRYEPGMYEHCSIDEMLMDIISLPKTVQVWVKKSIDRQPNDRQYDAIATARASLVGNNRFHVLGDCDRNVA